LDKLDNTGKMLDHPRHRQQQVKPRGVGLNQVFDVAILTAKTHT